MTTFVLYCVRNVMFKRPSTICPQLFALILSFGCAMLSAKAMVTDVRVSIVILGGLGTSLVRIGLEPDTDEVDERMPQ